MKRYIVGGAVRDALLGQPGADRDWVVVGETPESMQAAGFRPVGRDFPVFLHPDTQEEHALARTERKTAPGYRGFVVHADPAVTLEEDLARRDLTVNAIARAEDGSLIDPWGGAKDLAARVFRHVSPAFVEDPVRILRLARFAARFTDFSVAPETLALMRQMVEAGEVDHLVAERVWQEFSRGLMAQQPSRMLEVLGDCGARARLMPELDPPGAAAVRADAVAASELSLAERYALLLADLDEARVTSLGERLKAPVEARELAQMLVRERAALSAPAPDAEALVGLMDRCDAWRRPHRFLSLLRTAQALLPELPRARIEAALAAARGIDAGAIAKACSQPAQIPVAVRAARLTAVRETP
ncbi:multifunctional CCA tRNA nucleotidyl transferase/2'3'-cyclic phosphodiesterase/2'nucleotidase/phosphatase [Niveibacterium sp. SC-1]|uniref:multifunctional CCA tRNA nucleotidyl transferase/2'3'-cyclic phosphodiesterase/2'nucleotidase/phosphatase n=1 Tax=Niveibacterium sp. SC-1 TaxID=3135646 RepID=UPI00311F3D6A